MENVLIRNPYSHHNPPQALSAAQDAAACDGASTPAALPLAFSRARSRSTSRACTAARHKRQLALVLAGEPAVNAGVAEDEAGLAGRWGLHALRADGAVLRVGGERDGEDGEERGA